MDSEFKEGRLAVRSVWWASGLTLLCLAWSFTLTQSCAADRPKPTARESVVADQLLLKNGVRLRGLLCEQTRESVTVLVRSQWLLETQRPLFDLAREKTLQQHRAAIREVHQRLETAIDQANEAFAPFLKSQRQNIATELATLEMFDPEWVWVTLALKEIARVDPVTIERRQLLAWAWSQPLSRVESRSEADLRRELLDLAISPIGWPSRFFERLPARSQSDEEWNVRLALASHSFGKPLHYQGTGDLLLRADPDTPVDVANLLAGLLKNQLQTQLVDLLGEATRAKPAAIRGVNLGQDSLKRLIVEAERGGHRAFRVTRMDWTDDLQTVNVATGLFTRRVNGDWKPIFEAVERAPVNQEQPELERRIQNDPQVKQIVELTRRLGTASDGQLELAIRFGANTMAAQQAVDRQFTLFREAYLVSLARPPLIVSPTKAAGE